MIKITLSTDKVIAAFEELERRMEDFSPVMRDIGELLSRSTKERIGAGGPAPDGTPWAAKSEATYANYVRKREGVNRKPLTHTGELGRQIFPDSGVDWVEIGASPVYAAMMQFGGSKAAFPHLWGDIPARPFMGLSPQDEENVVESVEYYLAGAFLRYAE
ncbi:MAG: phage virion morphogenesis protein [Paracoccaceae bacterium]